ncbi:MtrB/PioB family decaheme-associated outer membrane protein [Rhodoferax sp.]|uniref:MtrB/PioB family decaheme-associated outer membrane protein n=1 Tax=Rhodoferax sp. TaxID=50421 RepID=UPI0027231A5B|nr:MtrB/PioB family decaheme-associated outer membrane protein [Rhodoferax sp.]MDO9145300.1 MtrB/PioB family decaheme-associated outer membrane protein [Rhodoferax sp.]MDP3192296.1 MtrB/PioB family decaheme-associated outer membrane protein [Rhodoferax sp.]MDP3866196.1 MtrB/PioB family decaheme-associated outer membrane protein [Rhodoferax sp.]
MKTNSHSVFPLAALAAALLAAYGPVLAQESDELTQLITPESSFSVGVGHLSKDAPRFGQYSGVRDKGVYGLLDVDFVRRDEATGTWLKFSGQNLGLDSREFRISHDRQGDWAYYLDYNQTPRYEPYTVTTAVTGIGTANLVIPTTSTAGSAVQLKTKREAIGLGFSKQLGNGFDVRVTARNEEKDGARLFARGTTGSNGFGFTPEPINSTTRQIEAIVGYNTERLTLSGGYYGTAYINQNTALTTTGGAGAIAAFTPIGLPPDNQSHQLSLAGAYRFTPTTRGTFKVAYARATQDDPFLTGVALAPAIVGVNNLGARVDTTLVQMGLTARPMPQLSLLANFRYEDRDDKTPVLKYGVVTSGSWDGSNEPRSTRTTSGKLEASYQLPMALRVTGGIDYEEKERNTSAVRSVSFRDKTQEASYRIELRRSMSDTLTGAVSYVRSDRDGSDFLTTRTLDGAVGSNLVAPLHLADRERDKLRLSLNWEPTELLSVQFVADNMQDDYGQRTAAALGIRESESENYAIDAAYAISDKWQANAWASFNENNVTQSTSTTNPNRPWAANLGSKTNAFGVGLRGQISAKLEAGVDLSHSDIVDKYQQAFTDGGAGAAPVLPDVATRLTSVKLFGTYTVDKRSSVRLDYVYDRYKSNDWTWSNFTYADGTRLSQNPKQSVNFIGVSYMYKFQ